MNFKDWYDSEESEILENSNNPPCPKCGAPMTLRTNRQNGNQFYGCSNFGKTGCKGSGAYNPNYKKPVEQPKQQVKQVAPTVARSILNNPEDDMDEIHLKRTWTYAKVTKKGDKRFPVFGKEIAASKRQDGNWDYIVLDNPQDRGLIYQDEISSGLIQSLRDIKTGKGLTTQNPSLEDLEQKFSSIGTDQEEVQNQQQVQPEQKKNNKTIAENQISQEQTQIDQRFGDIVNGKQKQHIMINALAGTGKTTMLKHLAWKYGKPGQKWLYIVFNTKNKVEASEEFPSFVDVRTSNGFLGEVLQMPQNINNIGNTERMVSLQNNRSEKDNGGGKLEKSRLIADSPEFSALMKNLGIPEKVDLYQYGKVGKTLNSLLKGIQYNFKESVLQLVGLGKSFALDPRNGAGLSEGLDNIFSSYDIDTEMIDTKERIAKYGSSYRDTVEHYLEEILGYDFMTKNFQQEIKQATVWMMTQLMPNATRQRYGQGRLGVELANFRDFDDDLWYAATHANQLVWPKYNIVLADEVQDFNENQKIMLQKLSENGARIVAVGDPNQCHPSGTMIEITGKGKKPIEEVQVGDEVVVYNTKKSYFPGTLTQGRKVLETACRPYNGNMITIKAGGYKQLCTPNHRCLVKFNADDKYCLYLMVKGDQGRIGTCRVNYQNGFGVGMRSRQEGADRSWLLAMFDSNRAARVAEYLLSLQFGLPQLIFKNNGQISPPESYITEVYEKIGNNMDCVHECLKHFKRDFEFPIWTKEQQDRHGKHKQNYLGSKKSFMTQACNLISDYMCVRTFDGTPRGGKWEPVLVENTKFDNVVYSLRVEPTEDNKPIYIADNIVTFNSIYRFRGADGAAFGNLSNMLGQMSEGDGQVVYNLTNNFRSRPEILDFANEETHVKDLKSGRTFSDGKKGIITKGEQKFDDVFDSLGNEVKQAGGKVPIQTAFISRTNEPLVKTALQLLAQKIPFLIVGKDIAKDLIKHIRKISAFKQLSDNDPSRALAAELSAFLDDEKDSHHGKSTKKAYLQETEETTNALLASIESYESETGGQRGSIGGFKNWIAARLGGLEVDENEKDLRKYKQMVQDQNPVILTTAHKSKGLEFSRVYVLRYDQFPHPKAQREEDLQQEENAKYVTLTRAKDELHILDLEGQPGYKGKARNNSQSDYDDEDNSPVSGRKNW